MDFKDFNLIEPLIKAVEESGYTEPTPIQRATVSTALDGKDILGCAQTGTGKTAAFVLPILQKLSENPSGIKPGTGYPIRALILAPTRELAIQNYETVLKLGKHLNLRTCVIFGGVNQNSQVQAIKRGVDILVATPGRLLDLIKQGFIHLQRIEIFVLDEADRMLDMGFIHDVKAIITLLPKQKQTLLFSATMPAEVENLAFGLLNDPETIKVDPVTSTVEKIEQSVYFISRENKKKLLIQLIKEKGVSTALIFTRTKSNADQVVRILRQNGIEAMAIHGNKSQNARQTALNNFKSGKIGILAATDIAARGIDIVELPYVINYNIPEEAETYIHRIGRTGRAGLGGKAISMCCGEELSSWLAIEKLTKADIEVKQSDWSLPGIEILAKPAPIPVKKPQSTIRSFSATRRRGGKRR